MNTKSNASTRFAIYEKMNSTCFQSKRVWTTVFEECPLLADTSHAFS
jgi:hypothetical protein